jgi:hypothetical protein
LRAGLGTVSAVQNPAFCSARDGARRENSRLLAARGRAKLDEFTSISARRVRV